MSSELTSSSAQTYWRNFLILWCHVACFSSWASKGIAHFASCVGKLMERLSQASVATRWAQVDVMAFLDGNELQLVWKLWMFLTALHLWWAGSRCDFDLAGRNGPGIHSFFLVEVALMFQTMIGSFEMDEVDAWRWTFQKKTASVESDFESFIAKLHEDMEETLPDMIDKVKRCCWMDRLQNYRLVTAAASLGQECRWTKPCHAQSGSRWWW